MTLESKHLLIAATGVVLSAAGLARAQTTVPAHLPRNGLVAFWTADGHARDSAGKNHGKVAPGVAFTPDRHGKAKGAFLFNGKKGMVTIPDSAALDTDDAFTLSAWINPKAYKAANGYPCYIVDKWFNARIHADWVLRLHPDGQLVLHLCSGPGRSDILYSKSVVPKNTWSHVAATFDRGAMKLYINGELVAGMVSKTLKRTDPDEYVHDDVHIGAFWNNSYIFTGAIDEMGIWNRALSDQEIAALASTVTERPPAYLPRKGLVAFWTADGHARDSAGKNHGTPHGDVTYTADRHGKAEGAFLFTDKQGVVITPDSDALATDDAFTLSAWIKPKRYGDDKDGTYSSIIRKEWRRGSHDYVLSIGSAGVPKLSIAEKVGGGYVGDDMGSNATAPKNVWTHVAATFDRGRMKIYVNGRFKRAHTSKIKHTGKGDEHDEVTIGAYWDGRFSHFHGAIDDVGIWNRALSADEIAGVAGPMAGMYVVRLAGVDRVEMNDTRILRGLIQNKQFTVATPFGKLVIPSQKVVGILPALHSKTAATQPASSQPAPKGPFVHLLLADGQVATGQLSAREILLAMGWGQVMKIPIGKIRQCGYGITKAKPAKPIVSEPMVTLRSRQRLSIADKNLSLQFRPEWGKGALPIRSLLRIEPADWQSARHKAYLANGSMLTGTLPQKLELKLALGPELTVEPSQVWGITGTAKPVEAAGATMLLRGGDRLFGRFAGKMLTIKTASGDVKVHAGGIASMQFDAKKPTSVTLSTWDNKTVKGTLTDASVAFEITPGALALKIPAARIANVIDPDPSPPAEMLKKIENLIAQLGADAYLDRDKAQKELIAMGNSIVRILKKHLKNPDPEIRQRLEQIINALGG